MNTRSQAIHATPPLPPRRSARRLKTIENARAFVADVIRRVEDSVPEGEPLDPARARTLLYAAQVLISGIQGSELKREVDALKREMEGGRHGRVQ